MPSTVASAAASAGSLRVGRRRKRVQIALPAPQVGDRLGKRVGGECAVAFPPSPDLVDRPGQILPEKRPSRVGVRTVIRKRKVELEDFRGQGLDRKILARVDSVSRPDEEPQHQRRQERQKPDDRPNHVARRPCRQPLGENPLQSEANKSAREHSRGDRKAEP